MKLNEEMPLAEGVGVGYAAKVGLFDELGYPKARAKITHRRPTRWVKPDGEIIEAGELPRECAPELLYAEGWRPDPTSYEIVDEEESTNVITNAGRDFVHVQGYGTTGLGANGLNYIALSNDTVTETSASTVLSNEIAVNGLTRAQGAVVHTGGTNTTTVDKTFTCATAPQAAQKAALFTASSSGTMNHVLGFTQRSLQIGDTLQITYTITIG